LRFRQGGFAGGSFGEVGREAVGARARGFESTWALGLSSSKAVSLLTLSPP
jgi:hypothetical protein